MRTKICAIVGGKHPSQIERIDAIAAGRLAVEAGFAVLTGGLVGVMEFAAKGAVEARGVTIGILPGLDHDAANSYIQYVLPSSIGIARNVLTASACDIMIALRGGRGTEQEVLYALEFGRRVFSWKGPTSEGVERVFSAADLRRHLQQFVPLFGPLE